MKNIKQSVFEDYKIPNNKFITDYKIYRNWIIKNYADNSQTVSNVDSDKLSKTKTRMRKQIRYQVNELKPELVQNVKGNFVLAITTLTVLGAMLSNREAIPNIYGLESIIDIGCASLATHGITSIINDLVKLKTIKDNVTEYKSKTNKVLSMKK